MSDDDFASNCPISRPVQIKNVSISQDFNGIGWSPLVGWMFDASNDADPLEPPPPGASG